MSFVREAVRAEHFVPVDLGVLDDCNHDRDLLEWLGTLFRNALGDDADNVKESEARVNARILSWDQQRNDGTLGLQILKAKRTAIIGVWTKLAAPDADTKQWYACHLELVDKLISERCPSRDSVSTAGTSMTHLTATSAPGAARRTRAGRNDDGGAEHDTGKTHRPLHDALTDQLLERARQLKEQNMQLQQLVRQDTAILDAAQLALSTNWSRFKGAVASMAGLSRRSWRTTLIMWGLFLLSFIVFILAYVFIRVTYK